MTVQLISVHHGGSFRDEVQVVVYPNPEKFLSLNLLLDCRSFNENIFISLLSFKKRLRST